MKFGGNILQFPSTGYRSTADGASPLIQKQIIYMTPNNIFIENKDITSLTTFGLKVRAKLFAEYSNVKELLRIIRTDEYRNNIVFHIGGGSNLLFHPYFDGIILHSAIKELQIYRKNEKEIYVIAGAGEKWEDFVDFCVENDLGGAENMAAIPGEVGAAPVQNVGAYGAEASSIIYSVECLDLQSLEVVTLKGDKNFFGFKYRNSNFKNIWKGRYYILRVCFKLQPGKIASNFEYKQLADFRNNLGYDPSIREVRDEVIRLRNSKLPDPRLIGSAGSFFKNPVIRLKYKEAEVDYAASQWTKEKIRFFSDHNDGVTEYVKIPAGWLIDKAGLKNARIGGAYIYPENALVIANDGTATVEDVELLASMVERKINELFHIHLEREVNIIDTDICVTVLGSGTSKGVPELLCDCRVCRSGNPLDRRRRASILVQTMGINILIDASPDFRLQALDANLTHIDAVLLTHEHYDHVGGIDDLRPYCLNSPVEIYAREDVDAHLRRRLDYCFGDHRYPGVPSFKMHILPNNPFEIKGIKITPIEVMHGKMPIYGYRIGNFAYITDAKTIPEEEMQKLYGLDTLIINALRERDHFAHLTLKEALTIIDELKPRRAYLTHLCHEVGLHDEFNAIINRDNVHPAFDGLELIVNNL